MRLQKKHEVLEHLKKRSSNYKDLISNLFSIIDPDKKNYKELIWLMAMPDSLKKEAHNLVRYTINAIEPEPETLGDLINEYPQGTIFDDQANGRSYQLEGRLFDAGTGELVVGEYACRDITTNEMHSLPLDLKIKWVF